MKPLGLILVALATIFLQPITASIFRTNYGMNRASKYPQENLDVPPYSETTNSPLITESRTTLNVEGKAIRLRNYFINVDKECDSHLYGAFFPHTNPNASTILWLQGGPGGSSMYGLFEENGPFYVKPDLTLGLRKYAWTNDYSVLFIDSPVGTGFSYTKNVTECYAHGLDKVTKDLYTFLVAFSQSYPGISENPFYITGESYAGKYIPYLAKRILDAKQQGESYLDLKGIAIGDGFTDPYSMYDYASLLYQIGLIDDNQRNHLSKVQETGRQQIVQEKWLDYFDTVNWIIDGDLGTKSLFNEYTGLSYYFNYLQTLEPKDSYFVEYLNSPKGRQQWGLDKSVVYHDGSLVEHHMREDFGKTALPQLEAVLDSNLPVLLYNGNLDLIVAPVLTENMLLNIKWKGAEAYLNSTKLAYRVQDNDVEVAGYIRSEANFSFVVIRNAGHIVPYDQPRVMYDLLKRFINNDLPKE